MISVALSRDAYSGVNMLRLSSPVREAWVYRAGPEAVCLLPFEDDSLFVFGDVPSATLAAIQAVQL